jgi:hypothetical protein
MTTPHFLTAAAAARDKSMSADQIAARAQDQHYQTWAVVELPNGKFNAVRVIEGYPSGTVCAYRDGRKIL